MAMREEARAAACRSPSTASPRSRVGEVHTSRLRRRSTSGSATSSSRPSCARTPASSRRPAARSSRFSSRSRTSAATSSRTRPGRRTGRARWRRWPARAKARGYSYLAVPTTRTTCATGSSPRKRKELDALNATLKPFRLLHGVEVNIRANGTLDVADETLAELDWVVASIHAAFSTNHHRADHCGDGEPHVDVIGHLTGRKINRRADARRPRAGLRRGCRNGHGAGDQLPARPTRPPGCRCAGLAGERGVRIVVSTTPTRRRRSTTRRWGSGRRSARG